MPTQQYSLTIAQLVHQLMQYPKDMKVAACEPCEAGFSDRVSTCPAIDNCSGERVVLIHSLVAGEISETGYGGYTPKTEGWES